MGLLRHPVRIARGVTGTAAVNISNLVFGAATGVLVARILGPTAQGELVIASIGPQVVQALMIVGIDEAVVYRLARSTGPVEEGRVMGSALAAAASLGLLAVAVAGSFQWLYFTPLLHLVGVVPSYTFATLPFLYITTQVMLGTMRARQQYALWNVCRASIPVMYLALVLVLELTHRLSASTALLALYGANLLLAIYLAVRLVRESHLRVIPRESVGTLRLGIQVHLISIGQLVNQNVDQLILTRFVSARQLGFYAVAVTYASAALAVALAPAWHLFSQASKQGGVTPDRFGWLQRRTTIAMIIVAFASGAGAPLFITVVFGHAYAPAILPAWILLAGAPLLALSALRSAAWKASGRPLPAALAQGIGVVVTVVGLGIFASRLGILAAACTSVVAYATVTAVLFRVGTAPVVKIPGGKSSAPIDGDAIPFPRISPEIDRPL